MQHNSANLALELVPKDCLRLRIGGSALHSKEKRAVRDDWEDLLAASVCISPVTLRRLSLRFQISPTTT